MLVSVIGLDGRQTGPVSAERLADGRWSVAAELTAPGRTGVDVTVQRAGLPDATHLYRWAVGGRQSVTRPATVSTAPIGARLRTLALLLAIALALGWAVALIRSRRRAVPAERPAPDDDDDDDNDEGAAAGAGAGAAAVEAAHQPEPELVSAGMDRTDRPAGSKAGFAPPP